MPTVAPGGKILVSGANGFIAMWVVRKLLDQGYHVRGAVRSEAKVKQLDEFFKSYGNKVEWVIVKDITKEGAFDEAIKDIDGIEHMASPLTSDTDDPDDYIVPAVEGTLEVLRSALKNSGKIKRVVLTSSNVAVHGMALNPPQTFSEKDWGTEWVEAVKTKGKASHSSEKYCASKTLAEQAAWEFWKTHKSEVSWDLVALNPPVVLGRSLLEIPTPAQLGVSVGFWFNNVFLDQSPDILKSTYGFIYVEDIALAHVAALQKEDAGGERILVASGTQTWQSTRNIVAKLYPEYYSSGVLPAGSPADVGDLAYTYDTQKAARILGIQYKSLEEVANILIDDFKAQGWLEKKYDSSSN